MKLKVSNLNLTNEDVLWYLENIVRETTTLATIELTWCSLTAYHLN